MPQWTDRFPGLAGLDAATRDRLVSDARVRRHPAGTVLFGPGRPPEDLLLLLDGRLRVQQATEGGREIVLYRVHAGESCVLTTACLLAYEDNAAEAVAETDVEAVAIPQAAFDAAMGASPAFRRFVLEAYSQRLTDLFLTVEEIAFGRMDARLAAKLLELSDDAGGPRLRATHATLATELGTAREVVSRQMAEFARRGWVEQRRGAVDLLDADAMRAFAARNPV
ncbi:Crp/Fnr family transcriptional regulator [Jannaschia sp. Os4]|uniref:Crp/Fnr family transcriptional regulator n=1 Tax=Jannaschia sp. Os4 TaxID=2807617 RepID=UPI00193AB705|nr:Crp/Fnr family transcriptional regulator [Jannaschia sp. Os4]MBM2576328.1 Crp/Fnr family transcriptional regulator [Jannaschia sp. Os4]